MPPKVRLVAGEKPPPKRRRRAADSDDDDDTSSAGTSSGAEDSAASSDSESDSSSNEGSSESGSSSAEEESSDDGRKKRPAAGGRGRGAGRGRGRAAGTATAAAPKAPRAKRQSRTADSSDDESPKKKKRAAAPRAKRGAKKKAAEGEEDDDDSASSGGEAATGRRGGGAAAAAARRRTSAASRADGGVNGVTFDILPFPHPMTYLGPLIRHAHPSNPTAGPRLMPLVKPYRGLGASAANAASTTTANPAAPAAPAPPPPPPLLPFVDVLDASPVAAPVAGCLAALYVATIQQQNATDAAIKAAASSAGASSSSSTPTPSRGKLKPEAALRHRNATSALINTLRLLAADAKAVEAIEADEDEEDRKEREAAAKAREERRKRRLEALAAEEAAYAAALAAAAAAAEGGEDETDNANTNNNSGDNVKQEEAAEQQKEQQEGPDQQQQQSSAAAAAVDDDNDFEEEEKSVALARLRRLIGPQIEAALGSDAKANKRANKSQAVLSAMLERLKRCLFVSYSTAGPPAAAIAIDPTIASPYGSAYANASAGTGMGGGGVYLTSAPSSLSPAFAINSKTGLPSSPAGPQYSPAATHGLHCLFFDDYCDASDHLLRRHGGVVCGPAADAAGYSEPPCVSGAKELLRTVGLAPSTHPTTAAAGGSAASDESIVAAFENSRGGGNKRDREDGVTAAAGSSTTGGGRRTETSAVDRRREREQREREKARAAMAVTTNCPPSFSQHLAHYGVFPSRCQPTAVAHVATVLGGAVSAPQPVLNLAAHHRRTGNSNSIPLQPHTSPLGTLNAVIACDVKAAALTEDGRVVVVGLVPTGGAAPTTYSGAHQPLGSLRLQRIAGLALPGGLLPTSIAVAPLCPQTAALDSNAASASAARKEIPKVDAYTVANGNEERPAAEITAKMRLALDHLAADAVKGTDFYLRTNVDNFVQFRKEVLQPFCFGMAWGSGSVGGGSSSASSASASAKSAAAASLSLATAAALSAGGKGGHHHPHVNAAVKGGGGNSNTNKNSISFLPDVRIAVGTQHLKVFLCVCRVAYSPIVSVQSDADSAAEAAAAAEQQRQRDEERMRKEKEKEENAVAAVAASSSLQQQSTTGAASSGGNGASAMALANALPMISTMLRKGSGGDTAERNPSAAAFLLRKRQQLEQRIAAAAAEKAGGGAAAAKPRPLATRINRAAGECLSADRSEFFILKCFTPSLDGISSVSSTLLSPIASMAFALPADYRLRFYAAMDESMDEVPYIGAGGNGGPLRPSLIGRTFAMYYLSTIPCSRKGLPGYQISQAPREVADCLMASYSADAPNSAGSGGFGCDVGPHGNFRLDPWRGDSAASEEEAAALVGMSAPTFLPSPLAPLESYAAAALRTNTFDPSARLDARQRGPNPLSDGADSSAAGALRSSARVGPDGGPRNYSSSEVAYFLAPHAPTQALLVTSQGPHQQEWSCDVGVGSGARLGNANALTSQTSMNAMGIYPMSLSANRTEPATFNAASSVNLVAERNIPQSLAADGFPFADAASNAAAPISAFVAGSALPALAYEQSVMTNALPTHEVMAGGNGVTAATPTAVVSRVMAQLRVRSVFAGGFASAQREGDVSARSIGVCESLRDMMARAAALAEGRGAGEGEEDVSSSAVGGQLNPFATPTVKKNKATAQSSAAAAAGHQQQLPFAQLLCFAKGWPQTVIPLDTYSFFRSKFPRGGFADDDSGTLEGNTAPYYCGVGAAAAAVDPAAEPSVASNDVLALRWMPRATTGYTIPAPAPSVPPTSSADPSAVAPAEVRAAAANATASRTVLLRSLEGVLANEPVLVPELLAVLRRNQMVMVAFK